MPTLSIVLPNYNHARFISRALEAIASQSRLPDELIVIEDASTDHSADIIRQFVASHAWARVVYNEKNEGVAAAANRGLKMAFGDFIYFAGADDFIRPGFIEKSMDAIAANPEIGLLFSNPVWMHGNSGKQFMTPHPLGRQPRCISPPELIAVLRAHFFLIPGHSSVLHRRTAIECGLLRPELKWSCDWFLNFVVAFRKGIVFLPDPLCVYRLSPDTYSAMGRKSWDEQRNIFDALVCCLESAEYADVRQAFVESGILSELGADFLRFALQESRARALLRSYVIRRIIWQNIKKWIGRTIPAPIKNLRRRYLIPDARDFQPS